MSGQLVQCPHCQAKLMAPQPGNLECGACHKIIVVRAPVNDFQPSAPQPISAAGMQGVGLPAYLQRLRHRRPADLSKAIAVTAVCGITALVGLIGMTFLFFQGPKIAQAVADLGQQQLASGSEADGEFRVPALNESAARPGAGPSGTFGSSAGDDHGPGARSSATRNGDSRAAAETTDDEEREMARQYGAEYDAARDERESSAYGTADIYGSNYRIEENGRGVEGDDGYGGSRRSGSQPGGRMITVEASLSQSEGSAEERTEPVERDERKIFAEYQERLAEVDSIFPEHFQQPVADPRITAEFDKIRKRQIWLTKQRVARDHHLSESEIDAIVAQGSTSGW